MSMTGKTTNELFNIGNGTDVFSLYDFNVNFEKADTLVKALQDKDSNHEETLAELRQLLEVLQQNVTTLTQSNSVNVNNIANITNMYDELNEKVAELENNMATKDLEEKGQFFITLDNTTTHLNDIRKMGKMVYLGLTILYNNSQSIPSFTIIGTIPDGFRPLRGIFHKPCTLRSSASGLCITGFLTVTTKGELSIESFPPQTGLVLNELFIDLTYMI